MKKRTLFRIFTVVLLLVAVAAATTAMADVGNQNRYVEESSSSSSSDDDDGLSIVIAALFVAWCFKHPTVGIPLLIGIFIFIFIICKKYGGGNNDKGGSSTPPADLPKDDLPPNTQAVAAEIQTIDPHFSAEKFNSWAREVFIKLQQAWTDREWKTIRPFESEELYATHKAQLDEYIRGNKINVIEKIGIKSCDLVRFVQDGDKEVLTVRLSAVMRDYVIDATSRKVLESDPNKDWYMTYHLIFNRKAGVKTQEGLSNMSTTNCPNCGAPTEITSSGQCPYCGSIITTGEHDWVLTDLYSVK
ncbi:MAG: Tim44 domain-containing protein [Bacteroidales bacterium]|nr:Tim44 domain-containing protein [Bacteroidales bacterium]